MTHLLHLEILQPTEHPKTRLKWLTVHLVNSHTGILIAYVMTIKSF